ncbi:MAG: hypothetical protein QW096_05180 [Thermofilaceae archaeon]
MSSCLFFKAKLRKFMELKAVDTEKRGRVKVFETRNGELDDQL